MTKAHAICPTCEHVVEAPVVDKLRLVRTIDPDQLRMHADCNLRRLYGALSAAARNLPYDGRNPEEHRP